MLKAKETGRSGAVVPFHNFCAIVGYFAMSLVLAAAGFESVSFAYWSVRGLLRRKPVDYLMVASPAYRGYSWAPEFLKEEERRWDKERRGYVPFRIWGVGRWHGQYVNNDDTEMGIIRRTINPTSPRCEGRRVLNLWMFGGSTVYGWGVPDWATLPSFLSTKLNANLSECVKITNFGVQGYVVSQEMILLTEQLKAGPHPDIVVFYDGVNDAHVGAVSPGIASAHLEFDQIKARVENMTAAKLEFLTHSYSMKTLRAVLRHLRKSRAAQLSPEDVAARARATLKNYEANLEVIRALAAAYHFDVHFFFQPCLFYGNKPLVPFEQEIIRIINRELGSEEQEGIIAVYQEAARRSAAGNFTFLGGVFDRVNEPIYIGDDEHLGPRGNEIVAESIGRRLEEALQHSNLETVASNGNQRPHTIR